jgi:hypothetical protein
MGEDQSWSGGRGVRSKHGPVSTGRNGEAGQVSVSKRRIGQSQQSGQTLGSSGDFELSST